MEEQLARQYSDRELLLLNIQSTDNITKRLDKFEQIFVTKTESEALKHEIKTLQLDIKALERTTTTEIERLKTRKVFKDTVLWVGLTASAIINIVAMYKIFTKG